MIYVYLLLFLFLFISCMDVFYFFGFCFEEENTLYLVSIIFYMKPGFFDS